MSIDQMAAGREMDALVAAKVMGLLWDEARCRICGWPLKSVAEEGCVLENCSLRPPPERRADEPARYSTDIAAAWEVFAKVSEHDVRLSVARSAGGWKVFDHRYADVPSIEADTAPLAICRAALKAVL